MTEVVPAILVNFDNRLSRLEKSILPLHNSTQSLSRLAESEQHLAYTVQKLSIHLADIEATLQSIDKIASDRVGIAAEEQMILRGSVVFPSL